MRFRQFVFCAALLALCWLVMMAVHELGHVLGAILTGGTVRRVVLDPLTISRTEVAPNPRPATVVWLGPLVGCLLPSGLLVALPPRLGVARQYVQFFAGFCLIANGAYIGLGSFAGIGDCGEMLRTGTPRWAMWAFGAATVSLGLGCWHRLGSPTEFWRQPARVTARIAWLTLAALFAAALLAWTLFPG